MRLCPLALLALVLACTDDSAGSASGTDTSTTGDLPTTTGDQPTGDPPTTTITTGDPPEPVCCGCLCLDPGWSCAANTCLLPDGTAAALGPEAGFLAVPAHQFSYFEGAEKELITDAAEARLWYVFQPADDAPETRPLVVFFNGGPGFSTAVLFGLNTGKLTADPDVAAPELLAANPHNWTRFANLLYVDPRETGFSYDIAPPDGDRPESVPFIPEHDAAYVTQAILRFLGRHPQLEKNPVMLVGESYGGLRASLISQQFAYPDDLVNSNYYKNQQLYDAIRAHLTRTIPDLPEGPIGPNAATAQFGARVLIQPVIAYGLPESVTTPLEQRAVQFQCVADPDPNQCDQPVGWSSKYGDAAVMALLDPTALNALTGVDATTIAWLYADARVGAYPRGAGTHDSSALAAIFGDLGAQDDIYQAFKPSPSVSGISTYKWQSPHYGFAFLRTLPFVRTFITHAGKDIQIFGPDIAAILAAFDIIASAVHVTDGPEARPGQLDVQYQPNLGLPEPGHTIRFPFYPTAGHMVTRGQPGELLDDVEAWFHDE